jgi:hypothetical protein
VRRAGFLLLLALTPAVFAQTAGTAPDAAWETLRSCSRIQQDADSAELLGMDAIEAECPGFEQALGDLGYDELLPDSVRSALRPDQIEELERIIGRYRQAHDSAIDLDGLDGVLKSLREETVEQQPSLWARFRAWLREVLGREAPKPGKPWRLPWLDNLTVSDAVINTVAWSAFALVIGLALAVVLNELRAAGVLRRGPLRAREVPPDAPSGAHEPVTLGDLDRVPLEDRPSLLLRVLVETLLETGRLSAATSLTHRELSSRASFEVSEERTTFQRIARLAERSVYGRVSAPSHEIEEAVREGRRLDARLRGAPA